MHYVCESCGETFSRSYNMRRHKMESCAFRFINNHGGKVLRMDDDVASTSQMWTCTLCDVTVPVNRMAAHQRTIKHKSNSCIPLSPGIELVSSAFKNRIATYRISSDSEHIDYTEFFAEIKTNVIEVIGGVVRARGAVKVNMAVLGRYLLPTQDGVYSDKTFNTCNEIVTAASDLEEVYRSFVEAMKVQSTEFQEKDSGML